MRQTPLPRTRVSSFSLSAVGAIDLSPARKGWVKETQSHFLLRCFTRASRCAYPKTNFGSKSTPCSFSNARNFVSKLIFL